MRGEITRKAENAEADKQIRRGGESNGKCHLRESSCSFQRHLSSRRQGLTGASGVNA